MSRRKNDKQIRPVKSGRVWIQPEPNEELDARKLSRAFLSLALHQAAHEAEAQCGHGGHDEHV